MTIHKPERSISDIISQLIDQVSSLIRSESALARSEISEKISHILGNISTLVIGVALLLPGVVILLQAAAAGLVRGGITESWASLIVGGVVLIIGFACISAGINQLKAVSLVRTQTIKQIQLDLAAIQEAGKTHDA